MSKRVIARLALRSARPRDLTRLRSAFALLPELHNLIAEMPAQLVGKLRTEMGAYPELLELLEKAIIENPPVIIRDGGVIAAGYNEELDQWRNLAQGATDYLEKLELRERQATGIPTLKVGYNRVHGYYIEISRAQSHAVTGSLYSPADPEKYRALYYCRALKSMKIKCCPVRAKHSP